MNRRLTKKQRAELIEFCKRIYTECDDEEIPEVLMDQAGSYQFNKGYEAGVKCSKKEFIKLIRENRKKLLLLSSDTLKKLNNA